VCTGDAIEHGVVESSHQGETATVEALDEEHFPKRSIEEHWPRHDASDEGLEGSEIAWSWKGCSRQVVAQSKIWIIDANWRSGTEWRLDDSLSHHRDEVDALGDETLDHGEHF
jgi:hypothetical protein